MDTQKKIAIGKEAWAVIDDVTLEIGVALDFLGDIEAMAEAYHDSTSKYLYRFPEWDRSEGERLLRHHFYDKIEAELRKLDRLTLQK